MCYREKRRPFPGHFYAVQCWGSDREEVINFFGEKWVWKFTLFDSVNDKLYLNVLFLNLLSILHLFYILIW